MRQLFPNATNGIETFDEFFESGLEESVSPFLIPKSRKWGIHLHLKASVVAAFLLLFSFILSFVPGQSATSNLFLLLTYFLAGIPALIASVEDLVDLDVNIDILMTLAAFLSVLIGSGKEGALLLVLFSFSEAMEEAVSSKAKSALSSLKQLSPQKAYVVEADGSLIERSVKDITIGTQVHVKAGQIVPLDGTVTDGASFVNMVHLTGENLPLSRQIGDSVAAGARNLEGALTLKVTHTSTDSTLARIIRLITEAQAAKPRLQRWLDKVSRFYAITIISLSFLFALILPFIFSINYLGTEGSIYRALAFLIAASPCALIIAIPIAYLSAVSSCAKNGILLKGGVILDALARCKTIAMDKTGTLTTAELTCLGIDTVGDFNYALDLAYSMERSAMHPIAHAIVAYAQKLKVKALPISNFSQVAGYGLSALYNNVACYIGLPSWILPKLPADMRLEVEKKINQYQENGEVITLFAYATTCSIFRFKDQIRPQIKEGVRELQEDLGMRLVMLTGDHYASAHAVAQEVGLKEFYAELRPEDKMDFISRHENLAMVGDGINDAPALARASVGISMGKVGSASAIDASDIVLLQDNIEKLAWLIHKSRQVGRIVKQNLCLAAAAILVATLPALLGWVPLWLAVVLHEGGTVLVGLNALRLLKRR